jgi:multidrug resistance efflux pump
MNVFHGLPVLLLLLVACRKDVEKTSPTLGTITESVYASGLLKSRNQYQVFASVNGLIHSIPVHEGDTVTKGQPIFIIKNDISALSRVNAQLAADLADAQARQNKLEELKLNIELTASKLQNDSLMWIRQQNLWEQNIGSKVEWERAELNYKNSRAAYASATLRYKDEKRRLDILAKQARTNLEISKVTENDFVISSKINGRIYSLLKEPGEMVNPQTPLAIIGDANQFILELQVDEYDITKVKMGQKVVVTMDSYKGEAFDATITRILPILNDRSKSAIVEAEFNKSPAVLYPNLSLEANIIIGVRENTITIPRNYILNDRAVILENGDTIPISIGAKDYQKAEILDGLSTSSVIIRPGS